MGKFKDLTGMKFGRLTVFERAENSKEGRARWHCRCECGKIISVYGKNLRNGNTQSCGCLKIEKLIRRSTTHGLCNAKNYHIWCTIKARCFYIRHHQYKDYGGRGITMYPAWVHDCKAFYDYISKLPHFGEKGYTLDRIDNDGNYEPDNLKYSTKSEQARNRRSNHLVECNGEIMTLTEAAEKSGVSVSTLRERLQRGETGEYLFRLPTKKTNPPPRQLCLPF